MNRQELYDQIKESARRADIPDSLKPEHIAFKLQPYQKKQKHMIYLPFKKTVSAAAVVLLCSLLSSAAWNSRKTSIAETSDAAKLIREASSEHTQLPSETDVSNEPEAKDTPKKDAGTLYTVAKSYDQVLETIKSASEMESMYRTDYDFDTGDTAGASGMENEAAKEESAAGYAESDSNDMSANKMSGYSTTNLQTQGVDESDRIKTDGRYIYTVSGIHLNITDTSNGVLTPAGVISPSLNASDHILEFFVDQNFLYLLVQRYETSLTEETQYIEPDSDDSGFLPLNKGCLKQSRMESSPSTALYTYDITDPANPSLTGTFEQDGYYYTSRKIKDTIYLFTQKTLMEYISSNGSYDKIIPCVNEEQIAYDHIYVPQEGGQGLILSSINTASPQEAADKIMIVHNFVNTYVSTDAVYLYHTNYTVDGSLTELAKFSIQDGKINAVNAASVKGEITDTFAINDYQNTLRVLTTYRDKNANTDNRLFIFDKDLNLTGSLNGIARGEEIYAARYLADTAYFITYKNTDPLFAADLSAPSQPVLLGELKITGFSDYLHFWGTDKLLGIGYETDPDTGEQKGLKLVMFDITNPTDLKAADSTVLTDSIYSPAAHEYKSVLADPQKNLIGFTSQNMRENTPSYAAYYIFHFTDGRFVQRLMERLPDYEYISYDSIRGIYIEDMFYIASPTKITSFDMTRDFAKTGELDLSEN